MMRATARLFTAVLPVVALATPVHADDTFEAKASGAQRIKRIENLVWSLVAPCEAGDDTERRQCRHVRDVRATELTGLTLLVDADADAFDVAPWDAQKKSVALSLSSCIRCAGVELDGKTWFVTGSGAPPTFEGGKLRTAKLHDNARPFADQAAALKWTKSLANARVQLLVKIPAKPKWQADGKNGLALDVLGYRVFTPCDGAIVVASPPSGPAEADKKQCTAVATEVVEAPKGPTVDLTTSVIQTALEPVVTASAACFDTYGVSGKAKLKITVLADGSIAKYEQQGDFVDTPTGQCIDKAFKTVTFPRNKKAKTTFSYPIVLQ